jgi:gamma-glutamyl:cysteine ligase YbdK (ATP-grasp superfamily)
MPDQPTDVHLSAAFAALLQALAHGFLTEPRSGRGSANDPGRRGDYAQNRWAAARFGPKAELIHPDGDRVGFASELGRELLELVTASARALGTEKLLARIDPSACEADLQVQADTSYDAAADLVARSVA